MLIRTHLSITLFFVLILLSYVEHKFVFVIVALLATFIPDVDSKFSSLGKKFFFLRPLQWLAGHRKIFHSLIFLFLISIPFYFLSKIIFFGILLGYGSHIFLDCMTKHGIKIFYPFEFKLKGIIRTGGKSETIVFVVFLIIDLGLLISKILNIF